MHKALLFLILLGSPAFAQTQFYVSPAGNNASAGTLLQPWKTAQYALDHAVPGCTIYLMGGSYHENLDITVSGAFNQLITLTSYAGQSAVIDGTGTIGNYLLKISGKSYISIHHLEFADLSKNNACGILIEGNSAFVKISDNKIHDINFSANSSDPVLPGKSAHAIAVMGNDLITSVEISANEISNCRTGKSPAVEISGHVELFGITHNKVYEITNSGIGITSYKGICPDILNDRPVNGSISMNTIWSCLSAPENAAGILVDGAMQCHVKNNCLYTNSNGIIICCSSPGKSANFILCRNNISYKNEKSGISIGGNTYPSGCGSVDDCNVKCNTLFDNNSGGNGAELVLGYTSDADINSNLVDGYLNTVLVKSEMTGNSLSMNFNLFYCLSIPEFNWNGSPVFTFTSWQFVSHGDSSSVYINPQLVSPPGANLHLEMNSPAIDRGDSAYSITGNEVDMDTMTRVQNGRVDIGADEYGTAVGITETGTKPNSGMYYDQSGTDFIIYFPTPQLINTQVLLYDAAGKTIGTAEAKKGDTSVKFNNTILASGIYFATANGTTLKIVR